jgi:hypothetical protein
LLAEALANVLKSSIKATNDQWALRYLGMEPWQTVQLELIRAGFIARDAQAPYEVGPPICPLHS